MSFLAPWAMVLGALGAAGAVVLHLVARHRPAAWLLPTARFIPDRQALVRRATSRPRDLLLLALRVILLLCAGAAFARPVIAGSRARLARVVLLDRSAMVADPAAAWRRARALSAEGLPAALVTFDTIARLVGQPAEMDMPVLADAVGPRVHGSLTAGLVAARRAAGALASSADSVELVVVSPVDARELDASTFTVRALWPGVIRIERLAPRADSAVPIVLERAIPLADALGPALVRVPVRPSARAVRLRRTGDASAADSTFVRAGGTLVRWDSASAPFAATALAMGDDVVVGLFGRRTLAPGGTTRIRWPDGTPAGTDVRLGAGCMRTVAIAVPAVGDVALRPPFQRIVRGLVAPCDAGPAGVPADSLSMRRLAGRGGLAPAAVLASREGAPSRIVPWLLGAALACAMLELLLRRRAVAPETA